MAECIAIVTTNDKFVGMIDQISESFFDLLDQGSEVDSDKGSGVANHYLSCECNMVQLVPVLVQDGAQNLMGLQRLTGCLTALSHFISHLSERVLPLYKLLKKYKRFEWTPGRKPCSMRSSAS